jgi:hypothetical protein
LKQLDSKGSAEPRAALRGRLLSEDENEVSAAAAAAAAVVVVGVVKVAAAAATAAAAAHLKNTQKAIDCDLGPAVDVADEIAFRHCGDYNVPIAPAA